MNNKPLTEIDTPAIYRVQNKETNRVCYMVPASKGGFYKVQRFYDRDRCANILTCECKDYQYRGGHCKHIRSVELVLEVKATARAAEDAMQAADVASERRAAAPLSSNRAFSLMR